LTQPVSLRLGETTVAWYDDGDSLDPTMAPRPYLHPVRTLAGTTVTDACPPDHRWHLGVSVALQDVDKTNFWGGPTYVRGHGYRWLYDHGRVQRAEWLEQAPDRLAECLHWVDRNGLVILAEHRSLRAYAVGFPGSWRLDVEFGLENVTSHRVALGSPATNGRARAGYGGFFWRLPPHDGSLRVFTADADGEDAVHGTVTGWVAVTAADRSGRAWSVVIQHGDPPTRWDPWFVRVRAYPGVGSSLAWSAPVFLDHGQTTRRAFRAVIVDATAQDAPQVERWLHQARLSHRSGAETKNGR
jgi:hypothetical protein